jgi:hypothetical protein
MTLEAFNEKFKTEEDCIDALFAMKWPDGFRCPKCSHTQCYVIKSRRLPLYECLNCKSQTSLISETIFRHSRTPLRSWFLAILLHTRWNGINALELAEAINVTYKTAWLMCHKLRYAMSKKDAETLLSGNVRISDALMYRRIVPPRNFMEFEQPVMVGSMDNELDEPLHVKIQISPRSLRIDRNGSPDPTPFINRVVSPESIPNATFTKRHGKNINYTLVGISWEAERWMAWKFRGISLKHLQVYLDHFCYIGNRPLEGLFNEIVKDSVCRRGIDYPTLTGSNHRRSSRPIRLPKHEPVIAV